MSSQLKTFTGASIAKVCYSVDHMLIFQVSGYPCSGILSSITLRHPGDSSPRRSRVAMRDLPPSGVSPERSAPSVFCTWAVCAGVGLVSGRESDFTILISLPIDLAPGCSRPHTSSIISLRRLQLITSLFRAGTPQDRRSQAQRFCARFHWLPKQPGALSKALCDLSLIHI